jgi:hypothetical protein
MANTLLTPDQITKETLLRLKNNLALTNNVTKEYSDKFAKTGAKIGNKIDIRKPNRYNVSDGATLVEQDTTEEVVSLELDQRKHVGMNFTMQDLTLDIDRFAERYIDPAVEVLANQIDLSIAQEYMNVSQAVGTPGTVMANLTDALAAKRKLAEAGAPVGSSLSMAIDAEAEASIIHGLSGLFQSSNQIKEQYEKGVMGMAGGFKWMMDQNIQVHTVGAYAGIPLVNGAAQSGATLTTDGWTSGASALKKGDVFTIAGVFSVNPLSKAANKQLKEFVVTADISDTSGGKVLAISPSIVVSGSKQNVSAAPADNAAITVKGSADTSYSQHLAFHKNAFALGCADLELPGGVDMAARAVDKQTGLSIRIVKDYRIGSDDMPCRLDVLYGVETIYPELACRIFN